MCFRPLGSIKRQVNSSTEAEMICNRGCDLGNVDSKLRISALSAFMHAILVIIFFYVITNTMAIFFRQITRIFKHWWLKGHNGRASSPTKGRFLRSNFSLLESRAANCSNEREEKEHCVWSRAASFFLYVDKSNWVRQLPPSGEKWNWHGWFWRKVFFGFV